jgi:hypothetical protein
MTNLFVILSVLTSFLTNLETKTLKSDFTITVAEDVTSPMNYLGTLTMQGSKFLLTMYNLQAAYDGQTLYMYANGIDELTLSEPTQQELLEANPFLYAKALVDVCNVTERASQDGTQTIITLTPRDHSIGINRFTLRVRTADLMPLQLDIKEGNKSTTVKLSNPAYITTPVEYKITPDADTYINDMRL